MHTSLHPVHQTERNKTSQGLGGRQVGYSFIIIIFIIFLKFLLLLDTEFLTHQTSDSVPCLNHRRGMHELFSCKDWAGCVALCYDGFSENPKLSNVELG